MENYLTLEGTGIPEDLVIGADGGGGVLVHGGTVTINGGEISGCTSRQHGGGVHVSNSGSLIMNDGKITDNEAIDLRSCIQKRLSRVAICEI